jgi:hypothetical protein
VKTISVGVADTGEGDGAVEGDGLGAGSIVGDTGLAPSQPINPIANTKTRNPDCVLFVMNFPPTLEAGKGRRNLNAASTHASGTLSESGPTDLFTFAHFGAPCVASVVSKPRELLVDPDRVEAWNHFSQFALTVSSIHF